MTKKYKVWIEIEEKDEENDEYNTIQQYGVAEFETLEKAILLADMLSDRY